MKLESLRLEEIGPPKKLARLEEICPPETPCCYVANLCATLPFAKNLTTLWYLF